MNKVHIVISSKFKKSYTKIIKNLTDNQSFRLAKALDNLKQILTVFPESFPVIIFDKHCEIPFRKAVIVKNFIVVYLYQKEKVYFIDIFHTTQNWKSRLMRG